MAFVGYPETKNRKVYQQNKIKGLVQCNGCKVIEVTDERVRLPFNRKSNIDTRSRQRVTSPDPHGMSGGAMFGVAVNAGAIEGTPSPKLVGITTDCPNAHEVFGPSIAIIMAIIRDGWQVALPPCLNPQNMKATLSVTSASAASSTDP